MNTINPPKKLDWQITASATYLVIPNILFGIYLSNIALTISLVASFYIIWIALKRSPSDIIQSNNRFITFLLLFIAIIWVYWSGLTGQIYMNSDWPVRLTVLNDLVNKDWPVIYWNESQNYFLRAPIGYYLPSATIGKLFNSYIVSLWALFVWTVIGVYLTLSIALKNLSAQKTLLGAFFIIFFSGLDVIGYTLTHHGVIHIGDHIEWWNKWQYSSNTTLLFWVPNHAISAWIFTALMMRKADDSIFWSISPILLAMTIIFSPLSFIGALVLYCIYFFKQIRASILQNRFFQISTFIAILITLITGQYLIVDFGEMPISTFKYQYSFLIMTFAYVVFIFLEFGFLILFLKSKILNKKLLKSSCAILLLLPLLPDFGPGNDLVMRASIAPLFCLCLLILEELFVMHNFNQKTISPLAWVFCILASTTALSEISRPLLVKAKTFVPIRNLYEFTEGKSKHYYARCNKTVIILCK